jgi:ionotropic glutamate receptor
LKSYFTEVTEPTTYGPFHFPPKNRPFNGHSYMKFDMEISAVTIRGGASVNTKILGTWQSGLDNTLNVGNEEGMRNLSAAVVYRIYTGNYNLSVC